jgi:hypothetical protein
VPARRDFQGLKDLMLAAGRSYPDVDPGAGSRCDRDANRRALWPNTDVDPAAGVAGLKQTAPGATRGQTRGRSDRHLGQTGLAAHKKGARRRSAWIIFQDESGFSLAYRPDASQAALVSTTRPTSPLPAYRTALRRTQGVFTSSPDSLLPNVLQAPQIPHVKPPRSLEP